MADVENAKPSEDDGALLAVEAMGPVVLQEPDRETVAGISGSDDAAVAAPKSRKPRNGLWAFVIGGALLAGGGFGIAKYAFPDTGQADEIAALQARIEANAASDATLQSSIAALSERPAPDAALGERIAALEAAAETLPDFAASDARLTALEDRLAAIETASAGGEGAPAAALAAMDREIKDLKARIEVQDAAQPAQSAEIEAASAAAQARLDAAETAAETAAKQAALSHLRAAFESGVALGPALDGLAAVGVDIPVPLAGSVDGLPSLLSLQDGFADPARAALDAAIRANMGEGWSDRLTAFLRSQSGARSLTPREGPDPDAVLSRAEAALRKGDLAAAVTELASLPSAGADAMAPWIADATRRLDAAKAIADLSATLNGQ